MDTATAATQAGVTTSTICRWCRYGAVQAVKVAGRWVIETASLLRRIAIGRGSVRYQIVATTHRLHGHDRVRYKVSKIGDPKSYDLAYSNLDHAQTHLALVEGMPDGYRPTRGTYSANSVRAGQAYWKVEGPDGYKQTSDVNDQGSHVDALIRSAVAHAAKASERAAKRAVEEAEAAVREARVEQLAELERTKGELASPRQVEYIMRLLAYREISGEGGGFFLGPTSRAGVEGLSKREATLYITSLKGDY